jgi:DNA-binding CsgD family transcriptional regulator
VLQRDRITSAIETSLERGVCILIAPAGFGKTEAVAGAYGDIAIPVDLRAARGAEAVARALISVVAPKSIRGLGDFIARPRDEDWEASLVAWVATRLRAVDVPIVVDDFERFHEDADGVRVFGALVEATVPHVRWIIVSRDTPHLPIGTWIARDLMRFPLFAEELAFSPDESEALAQSLVPPEAFDAAAAREICSESDGWPFAVRLALTNWTRTRALAPLRLRTRGLLYDYLESEVWASSPAGDREVMQLLATLERVTPRVLGDVGVAAPVAVLETLARRNPFVRRTSAGEYVLHELFREFVLLRHRDAADGEAIVEAAALAEASRGAPHLGLRVATRAKAWPLVVRMLHAHGLRLIEDGDRADLSAAMRELPTMERTPVVRALRGLLFAAEGRDVAADAELRSLLDAPDLDVDVDRAVRICVAGMMLSSGESDAALEVLTSAIQRSDQGRSDLLTEALAYAASAASMASRPDMARALSRRVRDRLGSIDGPARARVLIRLSVAGYYDGDWGTSEQDALVAVELADAHGMPSIGSRGYALLQALAAATQPDTVLTSHYTEAWVACAREVGQRQGLAMALGAKIAVASDRGDDAAYDAAWDEFRRLGIALPPRYTFHLRQSKVVHDVGVGRFRDALTTLSTMPTDDLSPTLLGMQNASLALVYVVSGFHEKVTPLLRRPMFLVDANDIEGRRFAAYADQYRALSLWLMGRTKDASRAAASQISDLVERDVLILSVMRSLCKTSPDLLTPEKFSGLTGPLRAMEFGGIERFLRSLFAAVQSEKTRVLTPAQLAIVSRIRDGMTIDEIARALKKSPRTVEWHIRQACERVEVSTRVALVSAAIERGWIDRS